MRELKKYIVVLTVFLLPWVLIAQGSHTIIDGYTAMSIEHGLKYSQTAIRILNSIPTNKKLVNLSIEAFILEKGFAQVLIGPEFQVGKSTYISILIGLANNLKNPVRLGTSILTLQKKWEGLTVVQWGPESDYFYVAKLVYKIGKVGLGFRSQRHLTTGLYIDYSLSKKTSLWTQSGYDFEFHSYGNAIGIKGHF